MAVVFPVRKWVIPPLLGVALTLLIWPEWPLRTEMRSIRLYQQFLSPFSSRFVTCRFEQTCSHYALQVLEERGFVRGNWAVLLRLVHCSPVGALYDWIRRDAPSGGEGQQICLRATPPIAVLPSA